MRRGLDKLIAGYWKSADYFKTDELPLYRSLFELFRQKRRGMAGDFDDKNRAKPILMTPLIKMTWRQYLKSVRQEGSQGTDERIIVLDEARRLFDAKKSLREMSKAERQGIAGFERGSDFPWGWFWRKSSVRKTKGTLMFWRRMILFVRVRPQSRSAFSSSCWSRNC
jgi:hypothetical protein